MATREERQAWRQHHRKQAAYELAWRGRIFRALRKQKKPFIDVAKEVNPFTAMVRIDELIKPDELTKVLTRLYAEITPKEAREYYASVLNQKAETMLGFGQSIDWLNDVQEYLRTWLAAQITRMTDYTKRLMLAYISEGIQNGDSYDQIIGRMQATGIDRVRAATISRSETNRALGYAKFTAAQKLPYPTRMFWVAARDARTRGFDNQGTADHFHMSGQSVMMGEPFKDPRNGDQLMFPGDLSLGAGASSTINCRCTLISKRVR